MEGMEEKIGAILSNPEMMKTIMTMAQNLGQNIPQQEPQQTQAQPQKQSQPQQKPQLQTKSAPSIGKNELEMISKISSLTQQTGLDRQEQTLLKALNPYLSRDRLEKLEKAMHAAKMAKFATVAFSQSGGQFKTGR